MTIKSNNEQILDDFYDFSKGGFSHSKLASLLLLAETQSITATANKKNCDAGSITRDISDLDRAFGCKLRRKVGKNTTISAEGLELVRMVRRHLVELKSFRDKHSKNLTSVSLAAGDSLLHVGVIPNLHEIQSAFKRTTISVSAATTFEIIQGLQDFTLDLGLLRKSSLPRPGGSDKGQPQSESLESKEIGEYKYGIFIPNTLCQPENMDETKVFTLPFAMIKHHWDTNFLRLAEDHNVALCNVKVLCENFIQVFHLVRVGRYAGILPLFCRPMLHRAVCIEPEFLKEQIHQVVLAWNPSLVKIKTSLQPFITATISALRGAF